MTDTDNMTVPPPRVDPLAIDEQRSVVVRRRLDLVTAVMRIRDCSKSRASEWIDENGATHAERYVRTACRESRWGGRWGDDS